jgi:hypothetical protein
MEMAFDAAPDDDTRLHEFSLPKKVEAFKRLGTVWAAHLSTYELTLVAWLMSNTLCRGKRSGTYSYPQLMGGVPNHREGGMWTGGLRISERKLRNVIEALRVKGLIETALTERGTRFTVMLEWSPETGKAEESNVVPLNLQRPRRRAGRTPVQQRQATAEEAVGEWDGALADDEAAARGAGGERHRVPGVRGTPCPPSIEKPTKQETYKGTTVATAAEAYGPRTVLPEIRKRNRSAASVQTSSGFVPETSSPSPRCAAPPPATPGLPPGDERHRSDLAKLHPEARRAAILSRADPFAWEATWAAAWAETYEAAGCLGWSKKAGGMLRMRVKNSWPSNRMPEVHAMLEFTVRNWDTIVRSRHLSWMTKSVPPERPDIEFVGKFFARFHEAYASKAELEWLGMQDGTKQAVHALVKRTGMTREMALAHVLAKARESADLVEARKLAAQAKRDREMQILAADRAERATRFTPENPHPRAHENKRPPTKLADKPIWETKISTPKFGEAEPDFVEAEWSVPHLPAVDPNSW